MTRSEAALAAMPAIIRAMNQTKGLTQIDPKMVAELSFKFADAMVKAEGPKDPGYGAAPVRSIGPYNFDEERG